VFVVIYGLERLDLGGTGSARDAKARVGSPALSCEMTGSAAGQDPQRLRVIPGNGPSAPLSPQTLPSPSTTRPRHLTDSTLYSTQLDHSDHPSVQFRPRLDLTRPPPAPVSVSSGCCRMPSGSTAMLSPPPARPAPLHTNSFTKSKSTTTTRRPRSSSIVSVQEVVDSYDDGLDAGALTNVSQIQVEGCLREARWRLDVLLLSKARLT